MQMTRLVMLLLLAQVGQSCFAGDDRFVLGMGALGVFHSHQHPVLSLQIEGGDNPGLFSIRPAGLFTISTERTYYVGVGGLREFALDDDWRWGLSFMVGAYHTIDNDIELGHELEFYSRIMLGYRVDDNTGIRVELGHISNADVAGRNPGTELLTVNWVHSFD